MVNLRHIFKLFNTIAAIGLLPNLALADTQSYTSYGTIGLIDMPTAASDSDGRLILSQSGFDGDRRTSLTAQILPRLSASFRYSAMEEMGMKPVVTLIMIAVLICGFAPLMKVNICRLSPLA